MKTLRETIVIITLLLTINEISAQTLGAGNTLNFNGVNQYVELNAPLNNIDFPMTIALWFKPGNNQSGTIRFFHSHDLTGAYRGVSFAHRNGQLVAGFGDGTFRGPSGRWGFLANVNLIPGRWHHLAAIMTSATNVQLYLNGNLLPSFPSNGTGNQILATNNSNGRIGHNWVGNFLSYIDGQIDEFSFWEKALTPTELRNLMCAPLSGNEPNLRLYYKFNNSAGNTLVNQVAGGIDGTLQNAPNWQSSSAPIGDRSTWNYNINGLAIGLSPNGDSAIASLNGSGNNGIHLYFIDALPNPIPTAPFVPPSVNHYLGVFAADPNRSVDLEYHLKAPLTQLGVYQLASRPHNVATNWTLLNPLNNPISVTNRSSPEQYVIVSNCRPYDVLPVDTVGCDSLRLSVGAPFDNIVWNDAVAGNTRNFTQSGQYWFTATDTSNGCPVADTITITLLNTGNLRLLPNDTFVCAAPPLALNAFNAQAIAYQWSTGSNDTAITIFTPGTYWVNVFFAGNCSARDSIVVTFSEDVEPIIEDEFLLCDGGSIDFNLDPQVFVSATWSNSQAGLQSTYNSRGIHWVQAQKLDGCLVSDTFILKPSFNIDSTQIFTDTSFCAGESIRFNTPVGFEVRWPNGSDSTYLVAVPQSVKVIITDGCTSANQFFEVEQFNCLCDVIMPNAFTPNGDGLNDVFKPVAACDYTVYKLLILNRWGGEVFYTETPGVGFDGTLNGEDLPGGTFIYKFNYNNGITEGTRTGTLILLR